ncbi:MAG: hypothetical protein ABMA13_23120 [Chthoniobacteraceae bacterium]
MAAVLSLPPSAFHRWLCAALLVVGMMADGTHAADKRERKDVAIPPPQPVPQEIKAERGQEIVIPLRIYGRRNQPLTFLIRKPPRTGVLSGLKNTDYDAASIRYRSSDDRNVRSDVFEYAVKSTEGVSAAVTVRIEIIDRPSDLAGPAEAMFPPQLTSTSETQTIEIINRGGTSAEGECSVAEPWRLESRAKYRIEPGGRLFVKVAFVPQTTGEFIGELRFTSQPERSVVLRGIARDALAVKPASLRLAAEMSTLSRAGVFEVTNNTGTEQLVRVRADARLGCEPELRLAAGQTVQVLVRTIAEDAAALNSTVMLEAGSHRAEIAVSAAALPAVIRPVERALDLGFVSGGTIGVGEVRLRNVGGVEGWAVLSATPPFRVAAQRVEIGAGATVSVTVYIDASSTGTVAQSLHVRTALGSFAVPARVVVMSPGSAPPRIARAPMDPGPDAVSSASATPMPASAHDFEPGRADAKQIVRIVVVEPERCALEWHAELSLAPAFLAEQRELVFQGAQLAKRWQKLPAFAVERKGQLIRGTIQQLKPGRRYTVRVRALGADGRPGVQIFETTFSTPLPKSHRGLVITLAVVAVVALALVFALARKHSKPAKQRAAALKKTQRIA